MKHDILIFLVLELMLFVLIPEIPNSYSVSVLHNNLSDASKIDPKVLNVLQTANSIGGNFHTVVDIILENQSSVLDVPGDIQKIYSKNNTIGVSVDNTQLMELAASDLVKQIKAPTGVFSEDSNTSISNPPSPFAQYAAGIMPIYVKCKSGFDLMIRNVSGDNKSYSAPACFKDNDAIKAENRGIGKIVNNLVKPYYTDVFGLLPTRETLFINPNSTGQIYVNYFPYYKDANNTMNVTTNAYSSFLYGQPVIPSGLTVSTQPNVISYQTSQNTTVTVTLKIGNIKGLYWISVPGGMCGNVIYPLAVGLDRNDISSADVAMPTSFSSCPPTLYGSQIVGVSDIRTKWLVSEPYFN